MDEYRIRTADAKDCNALTRIAKRSKQFWGYPDELLKLWEKDLRITPEQLRSNPTYVILDNEYPAGFCSFAISGNTLEIMHMWVLPEFMGLGLGRKLLSGSLEKYLSSDIVEIIVISDPNATGFYQKFGFQTREWTDSLPEGRRLPVMKVLTKDISMYTG